MRKFIILGTNFNNKGAQTMLFIIAYELKNRYPDSHIFFVSSEKLGNSKVRKGAFIFSQINGAVFYDALKELATPGTVTKRLFRYLYSFVRMLLKRNFYKGASITYIKKVISNTTMVLDASGIVLSSDVHNLEANKRYLTTIEQLKKIEIPIVLMPQSFGPFDYDSDVKEKMQNRIRQVMQYPELVFAREQEGYKLLRDDFGVKNIVLSPDLVLQNRTFDISMVANTSKIPTEIPYIVTDKNVAIIPNKKVLTNSNSNKFYEMYKAIVEELVAFEKNVYLIWHSNEDYKICKAIKDITFSDKVHVINEELNFWQYEKYIEQFDYAIASRYHSIIHSFKHGVPCVCIGWAEKYKELFDNCEQSDYLFSVTDIDRIDMITDAVKRMEENYKQEAVIISKNISRLQKDNCFDKLFKVLDAKSKCNM